MRNWKRCKNSVAWREASHFYCHTWCDRCTDVLFLYVCHVVASNRKKKCLYYGDKIMLNNDLAIRFSLHGRSSLSPSYMLVARVTACIRSTYVKSMIWKNQTSTHKKCYGLNIAIVVEIRVNCIWNSSISNDNNVTIPNYQFCHLFDSFWQLLFKYQSYQIAVEKFIEKLIWMCFGSFLCVTSGVFVDLNVCDAWIKFFVRGIFCARFTNMIRCNVIA